ncbi:hypothetical protein DMN91_008871 [Ooceraea biroi]|uniref:Uncharacterized protein n=1 Tax=Ooceraea biroi TaxID=2015173 RepID=A0A3L8DDP7_OOCBI|nr:hypothetical protein DMN91_008871 [Ooceraea biroi]
MCGSSEKSAETRLNKRTCAKNQRLAFFLSPWSGELATHNAEHQGMAPTKRRSESSSSPSENNPREHAVKGNRLSSGEPPRKRSYSRSPSSDFPSISSPSQSSPPSHSSSSSSEILSPRFSPFPSPVPSSPWYSPIGSPDLEEYLEPIPPRTSPESLTTGQSFSRRVERFLRAWSRSLSRTHPQSFSHLYVTPSAQCYFPRT